MCPVETRAEQSKMGRRWRLMSGSGVTTPAEKYVCDTVSPSDDKTIVATRSAAITARDATRGKCPVSKNELD